MLKLIRVQSAEQQRQISWTRIADEIKTKNTRQCYDQYLLIRKRREEERATASQPLGYQAPQKLHAAQSCEQQAEFADTQKLLALLMESLKM